MSAVLFDSALGQLYGYLSLGNNAVASGQSIGVVLCPPFGQEAIRSHRFYRVLSDRLARRGIPSLRFDYFGAGESAGNDNEVNVHNSVQSLLAADAWFRKQTGLRYVSWFGLRFGAWVACEASKIASLKPDRLLLWDPITSGERWLAQLRLDHDSAMQLLANGTLPSDSQASQASVEESQGFIVSPQLLDEVKLLQLQSYHAPKCSRLLVLAAGQEQLDELAPLKQGVQVPSFDIKLVEPAYWNNDEAMNTTIVPSTVLEASMREFGL